MSGPFLPFGGGQSQPTTPPGQTSGGTAPTGNIPLPMPRPNIPMPRAKPDNSALGKFQPSDKIPLPPIPPGARSDVAPLVQLMAARNPALGGTTSLGPGRTIPLPTAGPLPAGPLSALQPWPGTPASPGTMPAPGAVPPPSAAELSSRADRALKTFQSAQPPPTAPVPPAAPPPWLPNPVPGITQTQNPRDAIDSMMAQYAPQQQQQAPGDVKDEEEEYA